MSYLKPEGQCLTWYQKVNKDGPNVLIGYHKRLIVSVSIISLLHQHIHNTTHIIWVKLSLNKTLHDSYSAWINIILYYSCQYRKLLGWQSGHLVKWLAHLLHIQKVGQSPLTPPALLCIICITLTLWRCSLVALVCVVLICYDCEATFFQIEREKCNIPVSIGRLLATWLAVWVFSQMVSTSAS